MSVPSTPTLYYHPRASGSGDTGNTTSTGFEIHTPDEPIHPPRVDSPDSFGPLRLDPRRFEPSQVGSLRFRRPPPSFPFWEDFGEFEYDGRAEADNVSLEEYDPDTCPPDWFKSHWRAEDYPENGTQPIVVDTQAASGSTTLSPSFPDAIEDELEPQYDPRLPEAEHIAATYIGPGCKGCRSCSPLPFERSFDSLDPFVCNYSRGVAQHLAPPRSYQPASSGQRWRTSSRLADRTTPLPELLEVTPNILAWHRRETATFEEKWFSPPPAWNAATPTSTGMGSSMDRTVARHMQITEEQYDRDLKAEAKQARKIVRSEKRKQRVKRVMSSLEEIVDRLGGSFLGLTASR